MVTFLCGLFNNVLANLVAVAVVLLVGWLRPWILIRYHRVCFVVKTWWKDVWSVVTVWWSNRASPGDRIEDLGDEER